MTDLARFLIELARVESAFRYDAENTSSGAFGKYQIMPKNWEVWAPKALGTDTVPEPTPYNQERVATWQVAAIYRVQGDWRRVAASWRSGRSVGRQQPAEWSPGTVKYTNSVCVPLGFPETTAETVLPEPFSPPTEEQLQARIAELETRAAELESALRAQEFATEEQRQRATVAENHRDRIVYSGGSLLATLRPFETVMSAADEFRRTL